MEHRYGSRIGLGIGVHLAAENRPLGHFRTLNIGRGGMFLATGPIDLRPNDLIRLQLLLYGRFRHLSAVVVHRCEEGIGVTLTAENPEYARFFLDALDERPAERLPAVEGEGATPCALRWARDSATLLLRLGERFDICDCMLVAQAIESIRTLPAQNVVVDFGATRRVLDSGMALLLLLRERSGQVENPICLANCTPKVLGRLVRAGVASQFRIAAENADRTPPVH